MENPFLRTSRSDVSLLTLPCRHKGVLSTNAKKVTVSVLYWYEKLSSLLTEIFKMILKRIKFFFMYLFYFPLGPPWGLESGLWALGACRPVLPVIPLFPCLLPQIAI